jgi:hypothetical protein
MGASDPRIRYEGRLATFYLHAIQSHQPIIERSC